MAWTALGSFLIGILLNMWAYGIVCHMYATYWASSSKDVWWLRCLVPILCIIDTAQTAALGYQLYVICVVFQNPDPYSLLRVWPFEFAAVTQSMSAFIVTLVLIHRLYRLTNGNMWLAGGLCVFSLAVFIIGFTAGIRMWTFDFSKGMAGFDVVENLLIVWHSVEAAMNVSISGALIWVLSRSRTGFRRTDSLINLLIRGALQTGCFATIFSVITVATYVTQPVTTSIFVIFTLPLGRIYSATLMDTILTRALIRQNTSQESNSYQTRHTSLAPNTIELRVRKDRDAVYDGRTASVYDGKGGPPGDEAFAPAQAKGGDHDAASSLSNVA